MSELTNDGNLKNIVLGNLKNSEYWEYFSTSLPFQDGQWATLIAKNKQKWIWL